MRILFATIDIGSGGKSYFEILNKKFNNSKIIYLPKIAEIFPVILRFIKNEELSKAEVIHSSIEYGFGLKNKRVPLIITAHHSVFDKVYQENTSILQKIFHRLFLRRHMQASLKTAKKIVAVSNYTKNSIIREFGEFPITVIYNGIDTKRFKPKKSKTSDKRFKLLFVGNLINRKGVDLLPKIMHKLGKNFVLYYTSGLRTKTPKDFNLNNMISLGSLPEEDLIREYNKCDALLFPTRLEGFGYAVAEAMACGKPIVSTNCSSIPELVEDGVNGFLCKINDVDDFVKKIERLANNETLREKIGKRNRKKILKKFKLNTMVEKYKRLYHEAF